nr:hypothetical protein [Tanacetum cinerariifolium]
MLQLSSRINHAFLISKGKTQPWKKCQIKEKKEMVTPVNLTVNQEEKKRQQSQRSQKRNKAVKLRMQSKGGEIEGVYKDYVDILKCYYNTSRVSMQEQVSVFQNTTVMVKTGLDRACNDLQQNYTEEITAPIEIKENCEVKGKGSKHFRVELKYMKDEDETDNQQTVYAQPNFEEFLKSSHEEMKKKRKEEARNKKIGRKQRLIRLWGIC